MNGFHVGRSWSDHTIEDECPCPQEPCGLVDPEKASPDCPHHPFSKGKTMRQGHPATSCPGARDRWTRLGDSGRFVTVTGACLFGPWREDP